jgi:N-acetylglucosaminyldiphosphoundecaprenol N-acetyl-beta-D-mannosaminyltransferase
VGRWQGQKHMDRVYGPDLMLAVMALSEAKGWRHFFYGGADGTAETLKTRLGQKFPKLLVVGIYEPPFRPLTPNEQVEFQEQVRRTRPDAIWIGLSTPKQERFMAEFLPQLDVTLMFGVGAAFDFHAGKVRQAPRWMQRSGLEWFFRLCSEPKRLWRRYFKNNPLFIARILCQLSGLKKFPLQDRHQI